MIRFIKVYCGRMFGVTFFLSIICVFLFMQMDSELPVFFTSYHWNVLRGYSDVVSLQEPIFIYGLYFPFSLIVSVICFGTIFCSEWKARVVPQIVSKMGVRRYAKRYTVMAAISGGFSVSLGYLSYVFFLVKMGLPIVNFENNIEFTPYGFALKESGSVGYIMIYCTLFFVLGAGASVLTLCVSPIITNKYIAMLIPYLLYRIYIEIAKSLGIENQYRIDYYIFGRMEVLPSYLTIPIFMVILIIIIILGSIIFTKGVGWKLENEKY